MQEGLSNVISETNRAKHQGSVPEDKDSGCRRELVESLGGGPPLLPNPPALESVSFPTPDLNLRAEWGLGRGSGRKGE